MEIKYIAHSSFVIKTKTATILTDPFQGIGVKFPKTTADIVTISHHHADHDYTQGVEGTPLLFDWSGEFEAKGVSIKGFATYHDNEQGAKRGPNVMYKFTAESISVLHCGDLGHDLTDEVVDSLGAVDILCIPVGGTYTIDPHVATQVIKKIEPAIVIPMHFANPKLDQKMFGMLKTSADFLQEMGQSGQTPIAKFVVKHEEIASESNTKVVLLESTA